MPQPPGPQRPLHALGSAAHVGASPLRSTSLVYDYPPVARAHQPQEQALGLHVPASDAGTQGAHRHSADVRAMFSGGTSP